MAHDCGASGMYEQLAAGYKGQHSGGSGMHAGKARREAWGTGHARERTLNMPLMSVTLDVLKLSGRLNATAPCRV